MRRSNARGGAPWLSLFLMSGAAAAATACGGDDGGGAGGGTDSLGNLSDGFDDDGGVTAGADGGGSASGGSASGGSASGGDGDADGGGSAGDGDADGGGIKFDINGGVVGGGGECQDIELTGKYEPPNVFLVLDQSCSMGGQGWPDLTNTVNWMISNYDMDVRFGMRLFPRTNEAYGTCNYTADVPIGDNTGTMIVNQMNAGGPTNSTPVYPGIHTGLEELKKEPTGERVMIVLTDGSASSTCSPSTDVDTQCATEISTARQNDGVTTYVIGLGSYVDTNALNAWAQAGGTPQGKPGGIDYLEASDQATLQTAFGQIISSVISCVIDLDPPPDDDVKTIEVEVDGVVYDMPLPGTTCPASGDGYIFPNAPDRSTIELCNAACDSLVTTLTADITYACGAG